MTIQPLSYQQQASSCWITSVFNGLLVLLRSADAIPNELARILYMLSSKDGTEDREAEKIIKIFNVYDLNIQLQVFKGLQVTEMKIDSVLNQNGVVIADIEQGDHSVLITGMIKDEDRYKIFDPSWETVSKGMKTKNKDLVFTSVEGEYNLLINKNDFFKNHYKGKIRLGGKKARYIVTMKNKSI